MKTGSLGDDKMAFSRKPGALCQGGILVIVLVRIAAWGGFGLRKHLKSREQV
ncbi:MAG TPA: hypothetical protein VN857_15890 [Chthoniobacterales bacterium]|nr:hypothetical protein [Chthoniobacterales bacterium]